MIWLQKRDNLIRWVAAVAAIMMMVFGVLNGETKTVLAKAVNICLECIGIG